MKGDDVVVTMKRWLFIIRKGKSKNGRRKQMLCSFQNHKVKINNNKANIWSTPEIRFYNMCTCENVLHSEKLHKVGMCWSPIYYSGHLKTSPYLLPSNQIVVVARPLQPTPLWSRMGSLGPWGPWSSAPPQASWWWGQSSWPPAPGTPPPVLVPCSAMYGLATWRPCWSSCQPHTPRLSVSSRGKTLLGMTHTPLWWGWGCGWWWSRGEG